MPPDLVQRVERLERMMAEFRNPAQLDPQIQETIQAIVGSLRLVDLLDVTGTDSAISGQVLKYNGTDWAPGTDIDT